MLLATKQKLLKCYLMKVELGPSETLHECLAVKELKGNLCSGNGLAVLHIFYAVCDSILNIVPIFQLCTGSEQVYVHC